MRIYSLIQNSDGFSKVEVEVRLWPGLPEIKISGLPDQHLKEASLRIKSALKAQGFSFPIARQILVNLRPAHIKKSSQGLELAIAAAYLWESGQAPLPKFSDQAWIYGGLNLSGTLSELENPILPLSLQDFCFIGGHPPESIAPYKFWQIRSLADLAKPPLQAPLVQQDRIWQRPELQNLEVSEREAQLIKIASLSGAHILFAGAAGSGKSTLSQLIHQLSPPPTLQESQEIKIHESWRPFVNPHHSIPLISMIGGGSSIYQGELQRAHLGVLQLDELLEFKPPCLEALREPMECGQLRVARGPQVKTFRSQFQVLATTNLCPCGDYVPGKAKPLCRFSLNRCRSTAQRLTGPLADRFEILYFTDSREERTIPLQDVLGELQDHFYSKPEWLQRIAEFRLKKEKVIAGLLIQSDLMSLNCSERRRVAILRIALACAWLNFREEIEVSDFEAALAWCHHPFRQLQRWDSAAY